MWGRPRSGLYDYRARHLSGGAIRPAVHYVEAQEFPRYLMPLSSEAGRCSSSNMELYET